MIASLCGQLKAVGDGHVVVDVGGVGYLVHVTGRTLEHLPAMGQVVELYTHLVVRENDISLFGFGSADECELFVTLMGASGVGPRTALSALATLAPETLCDAIARGDADALMRIPGVGRKTAQRLVLDLKDKLGVAGEVLAAPALSERDADVINALTALGYSVVEAQSALNAIPAEVKELDERILAALRFFGSR